MNNRIIITLFIGIMLCIPVINSGKLSLHAAETELLLFGFERAQVESTAALSLQKNSFDTLANGDLLFTMFRILQNPVAMDGIRPMECVQSEASEGSYSLKVPNSNYIKQYRKCFLYANPRVAYFGLTVAPQVNLRLPEIFNTSTWFPTVFPKDWSAYDLLRLDIKVSHNRPVKMLVEVEDDMVEPPVSLTYDSIAPGSWITLEFDLRKAITERGLDLSKMVNLFVRFDGTKDLDELDGYVSSTPLLDSIAVYLDNIRLCKSGTANSLPLMQGTRSPYTLNLPRSYGVHIVKVDENVLHVITLDTSPMPTPVARSTEAEKVELLEPEVIDILPLLQGAYIPSTDWHKDSLYNYVKLRSITAANSKNILVAIGSPEITTSMRYDGMKDLLLRYTNKPYVAVVTSDGGKSWGGFNGPGTTPTRLHRGRKVWEGSMSDCGNDIMGLFDGGCLIWRGVYELYPGDRVVFWRTVFTDEGWKKSSYYFVSGDSRFCHHAGQSIIRLPSGRLWCTWGSQGRAPLKRDELDESWAMYSDDEGVTWQSWRGAGIKSTLPTGGFRGSMCRYGDHVGILSNYKRNELWTYFDGSKWSTPVVTPVNTPAQIVGLHKNIYVVDREDGLIYWYNEGEWAPVELPGRKEYSRVYLYHKTSPGTNEYVTQQYFSVCGNTVFFIEVDSTGKKILCWEKQGSGGAWEGPKVLVTEETAIADLVVPRYGLPGFTPLAYNCWAGEPDTVFTKTATYSAYDVRNLKPWIKVLKVPVDSHFAGIYEENRLAAMPVSLDVSPNPFNPVVNIVVSHKELGVSSFASGFSLKIFNVKGVLVKDLSQTTNSLRLTPNSFNWNATGHPSGVYIVQAKIGDKTLNKRIMLIR